MTFITGRLALSAAVIGLRIGVVGPESNVAEAHAEELQCPRDPFISPAWAYMK
jgi:hypothetical protein